SLLSDSRLSSLPALPVSLESLSIKNNRPLTELHPGDFTTLPRSEAGDHLPLPNLTSLRLSSSRLQKIHPFAFATLPALKSLYLNGNNFQSISSIDPDAFGNLTTLLSLHLNGVTTLSPRVFRHLPCLQEVSLGEKLTCDCDLLDLVKWIKKTAVKVNPSPPTCLSGPSRKNLYEEDLFGTCPTTTVSPTTEPTLQICPTLSPSLSMKTPSQSPPVTTPAWTTPNSSKPQAPAVGLPESAVVGLAVGVPLFLIILAMAAGLCFLRRKGRPSAEHVGVRASGQTQQEVF
ncbi:PREDICTED: leucine-rich repeat-containing protein 4C-like, partial [Branchiostoma belcheri]|uniref:Leucine-rich repeat-containing protein 4C-like n=1 Tax=Branchiostoma belcheri TaxID=7741 RepID=A0A6P4Y729_BRABE